MRVFCTNPSGEVATEYYDGGLAVVNGHAYKSQDYKTKTRILRSLCQRILHRPLNLRSNMASTLPSLEICSATGKYLSSAMATLSGAPHNAGTHDAQQYYRHIKGSVPVICL